MTFDFENTENAEVIYDNAGVKGLLVNKEPGTEIIKMIFSPGSEVPSHSVPFTAEFEIIKGEGILTVDGKEHQVSAGSVLTAEKGKPRGIKNNDNGEMIVKVTKTTEK